MEKLLIGFQTLCGEQKILIVALSTLCFIGIIRICRHIYKTFISDPAFVKQYLKTVSTFKKKLRNNRNITTEAEYIIRKTDILTEILNVDRYSLPENELSIQIANRNVYSVTQIEDIYARLYADALKWDENRLSKRWYYIFELLIPIIFWLFRGINFIIGLLAYSLCIIGVDIDSDSRGVTIISWVFTFISGMASILSFCGITLTQLSN